MNNDDVVNVNLTAREYQLILESILFTCSIDVSCNVYREETEDIKNLGIKLRKLYPEILTENVKITEIPPYATKFGDGGEFYCDEHTPEILHYFPEIVENSKCISK